MFRNFLIMFAQFCSTLTEAFTALNHVMKAASERSVVLEQKSVQAAALSKLESDYTLAARLKEITNSKINKTELKAGQDFILEYLKNRT